MARQVTLNNGEPIEISIIGFSELQKIVESLKSTNVKVKFLAEFSRHQREFAGFTYLNTATIHDLKDFTYEYRSARDLSPLEIQADSGLPNTEYHRAITATTQGNLVGILICEWIKYPERWNQTFWQYNIKFIDVHEDEKWRKKGIATSLIKELDKADFLDSKILRVGIYSELGKEHIKKVIDRELKAEKYALIQHNYSLIRPPDTPGIYDYIGQAIQKP